MSEFFDIEQITLRGGPEAVKFGDPYTWSGQGKVESDRYIYLYGFSGEHLKPRPVIAKLKDMGKLWGWTGLKWERLHEDGTIKKVITIEF
jgi:hypothetical protein